MSDNAPSSSTPLSLSAAQIAALRARHVKFLEQRLVDDRARGDFVRSFAAGYDHVLGISLRDLVRNDPKAVVDAWAAVLSSETVRGVVSPIVREINRRLVTSLRAEDTKLGAYVTKEARAAIDELIARPDLIPEELVRKILDDDVTEEIMRDLMYDGLVEFNESVNPFFADWGLPAFIKRFMPIGSGAVLKSMSAVRSEFDKRLEPEIRKFLLGFSRKSKKKLADFIVNSAGDPKLVSLRQSIVSFFYEETVAHLMKNIDDDARMNADEAVEAVVLEVLRQDHPRERLIAELDKLLVEHGDEPVGKWLERIGVTARPDLEKLAEALWPLVKMTLESPPARAFYERVTWDFYATLGTNEAP